MIQPPPAALPAPAALKLADYQAEINTAPSYAEQVQEAEKQWKRRNTKQNPAFRTVRKTLETLCCGQKRCGYCENSAADEIDHVRPKSFYPDAAFVWENYVYACGLCNGAKLSQFALFTGTKRDFTELRRGKNDALVPPPTGEDVFIHPRWENPLDFFTLDLRDTFEFIPLYEEDEDPVAWRRADYTISVLKLNTHDYLVKARRTAYQDFRARLREYIAERNAGTPSDALLIFVEALQCCNHQAVWQEMKTQHTQIKELAALFADAPEALLW